MQACILAILFFVSLIPFAPNAFAESYIQGGNEIIKKIYDDIIVLKQNHSDLKAFDNTALKKSRRDELYITYGEPWKKIGKKEGTYIDISYSKLPMSFKTWECAPNVFYSLKYDLYVGYCLWTKDKLREDLLKIIEKDVR
jgi:hypothetical protein